MAHTAETAAPELAETVAQLTELVWNQGDLSAADTCLSPDFVGHFAGEPALRGPGAYRRAAAELRSALPDLRKRILTKVQDGDRVFVRVEVTGTHGGELMGIPPTGIRIAITEMTMYRFEGGKVAELWHQADDMELVEQLGVVPPKGTGPLGQIAHTFKLMGRFGLLKAKAARRPRAAA